jgi:hypothetical protein
MANCFQPQVSKTSQSTAYGSPVGPQGVLLHHTVGTHVSTDWSVIAILCSAAFLWAPPRQTLRHCRSLPHAYTAAPTRAGRSCGRRTAAPCTRRAVTHVLHVVIRVLHVVTRVLHGFNLRATACDAAGAAAVVGTARIDDALCADPRLRLRQGARAGTYLHDGRPSNTSRASWLLVRKYPECCFVVGVPLAGSPPTKAHARTHACRHARTVHAFLCSPTSSHASHSKSSRGRSLCMVLASPSPPSVPSPRDPPLGTLPSGPSPRYPPLPPLGTLPSVPSPPLPSPRDPLLPPLGTLPSGPSPPLPSASLRASAQ